MTTSPKISACLDCSTPIISDSRRCQACLDQRRRKDGYIIAAWVLIAEVLVMILCVLVIAARGCV
jgi:predicted nucleic acid-binding Zn ribbon protein